ncbi:hypothetical protein ACJIZ3_006388 [Penstemon smallii]|uniref:Ribosomal protein L32 n=1 Tax=Penstemon smallii TaxID=265156 RepID=A0ABD3S802_9LAMI
MLKVLSPFIQRKKKLQLLSRVLITSFSLSFLRAFKNYVAFSLIKE